MSKKKEAESMDLDLEASVRPEVMATNDYTPPETFNKAVQYFIEREKQDVTQTMRSAWELGGTIKALMDEGKYGENTVELFCEKTKIGTSWCYECKTMFETYNWNTIQTRFIETGVRPYALTRIASVKDKTVRAQLENKLIAGELPPTKFGEIKKQIEAEVNPEKEEKEEKEPGTKKDPVTKNVSAANEIRGIFGDIEQTSKNLVFMLEKVDKGLDQVDQISDNTVMDSTMMYVSSCGEQMTSLQTRIHACLNKMKPYIT